MPLLEAYVPSGCPPRRVAFPTLARDDAKTGALPRPSLHDPALLVSRRDPYNGASTRKVEDLSDALFAGAPPLATFVVPRPTPAPASAPLREPGRSPLRMNYAADVRAPSPPKRSPARVARPRQPLPGPMLLSSSRSSSSSTSRCPRASSESRSERAAPGRRPVHRHSSHSAARSSPEREQRMVRAGLVLAPCDPAARSWLAEVLATIRLLAPRPELRRAAAVRPLSCHGPMAPRCFAVLLADIAIWRPVRTPRPALMASGHPPGPRPGSCRSFLFPPLQIPES